MKNVSYTLRRSGRMAFAIGCLVAHVSLGQEFVRSVPYHAGMTDTERRGLYTTEELRCEPPAGSVDATTTLTPDEADRLIDQYRREAGEVGPARIFSAAKVGFHFGVGIAYDDNIRTSVSDRDGDDQGDEITTLSGGVTISLGDFVQRLNSFLVFDYTLTENIFAVHTDETALDQDGLFNVRYSLDRASVEFLSRFQSLHDPTADTAQRERRYLFDESLQFQYHYGDKTTFTTRFDYNRIDAALGDSNEQYAAGASADYQVFDKVKLGIGLGVGHLEADGGLDETYEQLLARLEYQLTGKVSVVGELGVDVRERGSVAGDSATPIFALQGRWTPFDGTAFTLAGFRRVNASESLTGEDFTESNVTLEARQRFFQHFYVLATAGYEHSEYENVTRTSLPARTDDYYFLRAGAGYEAAKYVDLGLFYQREQNDSTQSSYSYASNRVYLQSHFVY